MRFISSRVGRQGRARPLARGSIMTCRLTRTALLLAFTCSGAAAGESISLNLSGQNGAEYSGECILTSTSNIEERVQLSGFVPLSVDFQAASIACRIKANAPVEVTARRGSALTRVKTSGGIVSFSLGE